MTTVEQEFLGLPPPPAYLVTGRRETSAGLALEFTLAPTWRKVWVALGELEPSPERLDSIADSLRQGRRYVRGVRIAPPYVQPPPS